VGIERRSMKVGVGFVVGAGAMMDRYVVAFLGGWSEREKGLDLAVSGIAVGDTRLVDGDDQEWKGVYITMRVRFIYNSITNYGLCTHNNPLSYSNFEQCLLSYLTTKDSIKHSKQRRKAIVR